MMSKGKRVFEKNGLTELDKLILESLEKGPVNTVKLTRRLGIVHDFQVREALIGRLRKLELAGYARGRGSPVEWTITFKGEEAIA